MGGDRPMFRACILLLLLLVPSPPASADVTASFRYRLSNLSGAVPSQWARLAVDYERNEIYALNQRDNDIRIFDQQGMEIHEFGEGVPNAADIAIGEDGNIFILSRGYQTSAVHLFDYRGERVAEIAPKNLPAAFSEYTADRLLYRQGSLYLVDSESLIVVVLDTEGHFKRAYDLNTTLRRFLAGDQRLKSVTDDTEWEETRLEDIAINGFHVDDRGNFLFTVPVLFSAYSYSANGELREFGRPGSAPGKFGVAAGIVSDDRGYIYVSDRLRCVVLIFDRDFRFQTEFGYRGDRPSSLIVPDDLAIDRLGNLYVAQAANRGVSVFQVVYDDGPPVPEDEIPAPAPKGPHAPG
jgi:sugar lactone lactonase YvrE